MITDRTWTKVKEPKTCGLIGSGCDEAVVVDFVSLIQVVSVNISLMFFSLFPLLIRMQISGFPKYILSIMFYISISV